MIIYAIWYMLSQLMILLFLWSLYVMISNLLFFGYASNVWPNSNHYFHIGIAQSELFQSGQEAYVFFLKDKYEFGTISITKILKCLKAFYGFWLEIWYSAQNQYNIYVIRVGRLLRKRWKKFVKKTMRVFYLLMK